MDFESGNYQLYKLIHIAGGIILLGNIIVTAVWKTMADVTKEPKIVAYAQRLVTITDFAFTLVGVFLVLVTGYILAENFGGVSGQSWLIKALTLFSASAVIWIVILIPVQVMQSRMASAFQSGGTIPQRYWMLSRIWAIAGSIAVILPFTVLYFMVFKPQ